MSQHSTLSLVIPAKNEQENIAKLLTEAFNVMRDYPGFEVVLVDDGSSDQTLATARRTAEALGGRLLAVRHEQSIGQSGALATGILRATGQLIVTMDGDGQNPPYEVKKLIKFWSSLPKERKKKFLICGNRINRQDTLTKRISSLIANRVRKFFLNELFNC